MRAQASDLERLVDCALDVERESGLDAGAVEHLERARERMLVHGGRRIDPEQDVDVEASAGEDRDRGVAKARRAIGLGGKGSRGERPLQDIRWRHVRAETDGGQLLRRDCGEGSLVVVGGVPLVLDGGAELVKDLDT